MARQGTFIALIIIISQFFVQCNDKSGISNKNLNKDTPTYVWVNYSNPDSLNNIMAYNFKAPLFTNFKEALSGLNRLILNKECSNLSIKETTVLLKNKLQKKLIKPYNYHKENPKMPLLPYMRITKYFFYINRANLFSFNIILYDCSGGAHGSEIMNIPI